jgi:hypothetical protein
MHKIVTSGALLLLSLAALSAAGQDAVGSGELRLVKTYLFARENVDVLTQPTVQTGGLVVECPRLRKRDSRPCVLEVTASVSVNATSLTPVVWGVILDVDGSQSGNTLGTALQAGPDTRSWRFFISNVALGTHSRTLHTFGNGASGEVGPLRPGWYRV